MGSCQLPGEFDSFRTGIPLGVLKSAQLFAYFSDNLQDRLRLLGQVRREIRNQYEPSLKADSFLGGTSPSKNPLESTGT
jgi:hypothetical protein